jgi:hypothetical protein
MRLTTHRIPGSIEDATIQLNKMGVAASILALQWLPNVQKGETVVVFRSTDYSSYEWLCSKLAITAVSRTVYMRS